MSPNERFQPSFELHFCARRPFYLAENDATSDAMSSRHVPCYAADLVALSIVSRDGKDELQCLGHIMRQKRSSKITPMAFSSQSLASYLAENGHDIRQMTVLMGHCRRRTHDYVLALLEQFCRIALHRRMPCVCFVVPAFILLCTVLILEW